MIVIFRPQHILLHRSTVSSQPQTLVPVGAACGLRVRWFRVEVVEKNKENKRCQAPNLGVMGNRKKGARHQIWEKQAGHRKRSKKGARHQIWEQWAIYTVIVSVFLFLVRLFEFSGDLSLVVPVSAGTWNMSAHPGKAFAA